jgi:hypothetical protein
MPAEFFVPQGNASSVSPQNSVCVQTFFPYDLHIKGRKVVGSSQRRRGESPPGPGLHPYTEQKQLQRHRESPRPGIRARTGPLSSPLRPRAGGTGPNPVADRNAVLLRSVEHKILAAC